MRWSNENRQITCLWPRRRMRIVKVETLSISTSVGQRSECAHSHLCGEKHTFISVRVIVILLFSCQLSSRHWLTRKRAFKWVFVRLPCDCHDTALRREMWPLLRDRKKNLRPILLFSTKWNFFFEYKTRNIIHWQSIASRIGRSKKMEKCFYLFTTLPFTGKCAIFLLGNWSLCDEWKFLLFRGALWTRWKNWWPIHSDLVDIVRHVPLFELLRKIHHRPHPIGRCTDAGTAAASWASTWPVSGSKQKSHQTLQCSMRFDS